MAALLIRISSGPIPASAAGTRFSTSSRSARLQRTTCTRPPSWPASESSISIRVPEIVTVAPLAWRVCAMAPPMPPVAPVTRAVLPVRSNMARSFKTPSSRQRRAECLDVLRCANRGRGGPPGNAFNETAQHLAGADLIEPGHPLPRHIGNAFAPAHRSGDLLDQTARDLGRVRDGLRDHVGNQRGRRLADRDSGERLRHYGGG